MNKNWGPIENVLASAYAPPVGRKRTWRKIRQSMRQLASVADPSEVTVESIGAIVRSMLARGCQPETINSVLIGCRVITRVLVAQRTIAVDPFKSGLTWYQRPKNLRTRQMKHLPIDSIKRILARADHEAEEADSFLVRWRALRLRALVFLLAYTGLRASEALNARRRRFDGEFLDIRHEDQPEQRLKTSASERIVPIPQVAAARLWEWISEMGPSEFLFPCQGKSAPWLYGSTTHRPVGAVRLLAERSGVPGATLLAFRHSYLTHARQAWGLSADEVQMIAGHSSVMTQRHYIHEDRVNLVRMVRGVDYGGS